MKDENLISGIKKRTPVISDFDCLCAIHVVNFVTNNQKV